MNEDHNIPSGAPRKEGVADQMVEEAARRYKDIPKKEDLKGFQFLKLFEGRIDRENYIYALVAGVIIGTILSYIEIIGVILAIPLTVIGLGVTVRRLHDIAQTGWIALLWLIPPLGFILDVYLAFPQAVESGNSYGPKPDSKRGFYHAVLNI